MIDIIGGQEIEDQFKHIGKATKEDTYVEAIQKLMDGLMAGWVV